MSLLLIPFYYIKAGSFSHTAELRLENVPGAFKQMTNNGVIIAATVGELSPLIELEFVFIPFYYIKAGSFRHTAEHRLENVLYSFKQMANNRAILAVTVGELSPLREL